MPLDDSNFPQTVEVNETTALLIRARGFIERGWCRGSLALDATGNAVDPTSERAVAWCANGALVALGVPWSPGDAFEHHPAVRRLTVAIGGEFIGTFNNTQETVEPVLAAFDRAIAGQSREEPTR
jgi:hypothetical protein